VILPDYNLRNMAAAYKLAASNYLSDKAITILNDFRKLDYAVSLEETATSILNLLPKVAALFYGNLRIRRRLLRGC
jgi:hypothetical protein